MAGRWVWKVFNTVQHKNTLCLNLELHCSTGYAFIKNLQTCELAFGHGYEDTKNAEGLEKGCFSTRGLSKKHRKYFFSLFDHVVSILKFFQRFQSYVNDIQRHLRTENSSKKYVWLILTTLPTPAFKYPKNKHKMLTKTLRLIISEEWTHQLAILLKRIKYKQILLYYQY